MSYDPYTQKHCPYCTEVVDIRATRCRYCAGDFKALEAEMSSWSVPAPSPDAHIQRDPVDMVFKIAVLVGLGLGSVVGVIFGFAGHGFGGAIVGSLVGAVGGAVVGWVVVAVIGSVVYFIWNEGVYLAYIIVGLAAVVGFVWLIAQLWDVR